jgi:hypothetical protein
VIFRPGEHRRGRQRALCAFACGLVALASAIHAQESSDAWSQVERVIAFADVHGAYDELTGLLEKAGVVDADLHWAAGKAHVVSTGDLLDRGAGSRKVMDLLMRLQSEATAAGGMLHVLLGNHEAMNLLGDLRDATPAELASYADFEPSDLRPRLRRDWVVQHGEGTEEAFDGQFPPGFFGHREAFARDGRYGAWLLGLPVAIVVNDTLFMHGGPSRVLSGLTLADVNESYRTAISTYLGTLDELMKVGFVRVEDAFEMRAALAEQRLASAPPVDAATRAALAEAARRLALAERNPMLDAGGPNWYRGAALCHEASESDVLKPILEGLGARRLVIGHSVARNQRVASRFDGAVIKLDTGMNRAVYHGHPAALLLGSGDPRVVYADGNGAPTAVPAEPLYLTSPVIDDTVVASMLADGAVTLGSARAPGVVDAVVERDGQRVPAVFLGAKADAAKRELAAYRIDRELRLGLVPATVERKIQGRRGILQARPARWVSQADVESQSLHPGGWCALKPQFELMYAFDALIGNEGRTRERILYDASEWMLLLTGHDRAFGTGKGLPKHLEARPPQPGAEMRRRLAALDEEALERAAGSLLGDRERSALLARRDALLERPAAATSP